MRIAVRGTKERIAELVSGQAGVEWLITEKPEEWPDIKHADLFINLEEDAADLDYSLIQKPVIIHSVVHRLSDKHLPPHVIRINAWPGFLKRDSWEYAGTADPLHADAFKLLSKQVTQVPDEPGFIAARIICMIINEAYFAKGENVSSSSDIDTAMKLGTNYPLGPFEWAAIIGIKQVYALLHALASTDSRYTPSPLLTQEAVAP